MVPVSRSPFLRVTSSPRHVEAKHKTASREMNILTTESSKMFEALRCEPEKFKVPYGLRASQLGGAEVRQLRTAIGVHHVHSTTSENGYRTAVSRKALGLSVDVDGGD